MARKKKQKEKLTEEDLINMWMTKHYNTTIQEETSKDPEKFKSSEWYKSYPLTQKQHDEWEAEARQRFKKYLKLTDYGVGRYWGFTYLNVSPYVSDE